VSREDLISPICQTRRPSPTAAIGRPPSRQRKGIFPRQLPLRMAVWQNFFEEGFSATSRRGRLFLSLQSFPKKDSLDGLAFFTKDRLSSSLWVRVFPLDVLLLRCVKDFLPARLFTPLVGSRRSVSDFMGGRSVSFPSVWRFFKKGRGGTFCGDPEGGWTSRSLPRLPPAVLTSIAKWPPLERLSDPLHS